MVLDLFKVPKDAYYHAFFDNFFTSPTLIQKLHDNGLYDLDTRCFDRTNMPQIKGQRNEARRLPMKILQRHSLYQMV